MYVPSRQEIKKRYFRQQLVVYILLGVLALTIFGFIISFAVFAWYAKDLPSPGKLSESGGNSTVFYDREDKVLYEMYKDKNRVPVALSEISENLQKATIAIEDKNFYKHKGVSETGIIRAAINIALGKGLQSGSTITQQLIKNALLDSRRNISRKIREMILAFEVERRYSKDQTLEMYLNEAPYGGSLCGVGSGAKGYFNKDPKDLNLAESAILAGLPQRPSYYSPFIGKTDTWKGRAYDVLRRMREDGYITSSEEQDAKKKVEKYSFSSPNLSINAPHFVFYVKDLVEREYGSKLLDQGVRIKTTLDLETQKTAEKIVKEELAKIKALNVTNSAVVVLDSRTNGVLAMVGSYDFNDDKFGKFNAALGLWQPGSAIKPVTYALAFKKGYTPSTVLMDV